MNGGGNGLSMRFRLYLFPNLLDDALVVDQKGRPRNTHVLFPVHGLLDPDADRLAECLVLVRQEREIQRELVGEFGVALDAVWADTKDLNPFEFRQRVAELTGLNGAATGIVLGIEIDHEHLTGEALQGVNLSRLIGERKLRESLAFGKHAKFDSTSFSRAGLGLRRDVHEHRLHQIDPKDDPDKPRGLNDGEDREAPAEHQMESIPDLQIWSRRDGIGAGEVGCLLMTQVNQVATLGNGSRNVAFGDHVSRGEVIAHQDKRRKLIDVHPIDRVTHRTLGVQRWDMGVKDFAEDHARLGFALDGEEDDGGYQREARESHRGNGGSRVGHWLAFHREDKPFRVFGPVV